MTGATLECLQRAGWFPARNISTDPYEAALRAEGYVAGVTVRQFLSSFGALHVKHRHHKMPERTDEFHLDPLLGIEGIYAEKVAEYAKRAGEPLTVIGEAFRRNMVLLMSESGRVFAATDDLLLFLGNSGEDALKTLCEGGATPEV